MLSSYRCPHRARDVTATSPLAVATRFSPLLQSTPPLCVCNGICKSMARTPSTEGASRSEGVGVCGLSFSPISPVLRSRRPGSGVEPGNALEKIL